jgi:hypothetical protein
MNIALDIAIPIAVSRVHGVWPLMGTTWTKRLVSYSPSSAGRLGCLIGIPRLSLDYLQMTCFLNTSRKYLRIGVEIPYGSVSLAGVVGDDMRIGESGLVPGS